MVEKLQVVLQVSSQVHPEDYACSDVMHDLSTSLQGLPTVISTSDGLRYDVLHGRR